VVHFKTYLFIKVLISTGFIVRDHTKISEEVFDIIKFRLR